ncbi:hypothetical protein SKAU_G00268760 [Synaphobranchus kaupii]|uniref:Uncharacterized protein n=1 Tax=Synaphobranchus kaupii TaxID=118154 RepID=A0A9Q1IQ46_SYNKA|nr:hypothetical protein SKAU_G00268760 [Synaphobranchus kaupii]
MPSLLFSSGTKEASDLALAFRPCSGRQKRDAVLVFVKRKEGCRAMERQSGEITCQWCKLEKRCGSGLAGIYDGFLSFVSDSLFERYGQTPQWRRFWHRPLGSDRRLSVGPCCGCGILPGSARLPSLKGMRDGRRPRLRSSALRVLTLTDGRGTRFKCRRNLAACRPFVVRRDTPV